MLRASPALPLPPPSGFDFMVDTDAKLWLLEVNSDPSMSIFEERLRPVCASMVDDTVELATRHARRVVPPPCTTACADPVDNSQASGSSEAGSRTTPFDGEDHDARGLGGYERVLQVGPRWSAEEGRRKLSVLIRVRSYRSVCAT